MLHLAARRRSCRFRRYHRQPETTSFSFELLEARLALTMVPPGMITMDIAENQEWCGDNTGAPYVIKESIAVPSGVTLTICPGVRVIIEEDRVLNIEGKVNVNEADSIRIVDGAFSNPFGGIEVKAGGVLELHNTEIARSGMDNSDRTSIRVRSSGKLTSTGTRFDLDDVLLDKGSMIELVGNSFDNPLFLPIEKVPDLTNNVRFEEVKILPGVLAGQTVNLNPLGTNPDMHYRIAARAPGAAPGDKDLRIMDGGELTISPMTKVIIEEDQVLIVENKGTVNVDRADVGVVDGAFSGLAGMQVKSGGVLELHKTRVARSGTNNSDRTSVSVLFGGQLNANDSTFELDDVSLDKGSMIGLVGNSFDNPLLVPIQHVPNLVTNERFADVHILPGLLLAGQTVSLNPLGTNPDMRYRLSTVLRPAGGSTDPVQNLVIKNGAALNIGPKTKVNIEEDQVLIIEGSVHINGADFIAVVDGAFSGLAGMQVSTGGALEVHNTQFLRSGTNNSDRTSVTVGSGGQFIANDTSFDLDDVTVDGSAIARLTLNRFNNALRIGSRVMTEIFCNDFDAETLRVEAIGNPAGEINLTNNWWGTTDPAEIEAKIKHRPDDANLPLVRFEPVLSTSPRAADLEAISVNVFAGGLIAGKMITLEYRIANNSPHTDAPETRTFFYLNVDSGITGSKTLSLATTNPIARAAAAGQPNVAIATIDVRLPDENDSIWSEGLPGFYTISMHVDALSEVKEWFETNNTASTSVPIIPVPPNPLPGDYNYNGTVDAADYVVYRESLGSKIDRRADGNEDGEIGQLDYEFWRARFGATLRPTLSIAALHAIKLEGNSGTNPATPFAFRVTRSGVNTGATSVDYAVTGSGANPANVVDFMPGTLPIMGTVTFAPGQMRKDFTIQVVGDNTVEPDEGFTVSLSNPSPPAVLNMSMMSATGTIANDDPPITRFIDTVLVGNAGNADDDIPGRYEDGPFGSVAYDYRIGKYEVTNGQYVEFLNGVDPTGANALELFNSSMSTNALGGINFNAGAANGSKYAVKPGRGNDPVVFVLWYDAIRFANWLHNGRGAGNTEDGAYTLLGGTPEPSNATGIRRNVGARWWLPSEDEWYKAAYHKNDGITGNYWDYPTSTDAIPYSDQPPGSDAPTQSYTANFDKDDLVANGYDDGFANGPKPEDPSHNYLTDVGAYMMSSSPYGTFDQGGNVWEWNESLFIGGGWRGIRGGAWSSGRSIGEDHLHASYQNRGLVTGPDRHELRDIGFRVAAAVNQAPAPDVGEAAFLIAGALNGVPMSPLPSSVLTPRPPNAMAPLDAGVTGGYDQVRTKNHQALDTAFAAYLDDDDVARDFQRDSWLAGGTDDSTAMISSRLWQLADEASFELVDLWE